ncbi:hypothetical protein DRE_00143 [Drechslerella stenobrocha 248]|uniref:ER transporter 6TM N-terminal domain-containing protein n=1 Tax=Drechslerella stenobrocha 248 TaxID=1043628 RepID=W7I944_9PEZI|nr:hypothetical protein DRE_00143 [Drechslerella stenobrocha 248]
MADKAAEAPPTRPGEQGPVAEPTTINVNSNRDHGPPDEITKLDDEAGYDASNGDRGGSTAHGVDDAAASATLLERLPDWVTEHLTVRDLKILIRCTLATWAAFLPVVINPVLKNFGQSAFIGMLALFINPPSTILPFYLFAATTIVLGICLAWGWGTLAFLAAMSQRDDVLYQSAYTAIRQAAAQSPTPALEVQRRIYAGEVLQASPAAVLFVMCCVFIYFLARLQASFPKLILVSIFGMIVIDPYLTSAPLLDNFNGKLALIFVKPLTTATAIGITLSLLVFPESCSHATLHQLSRSLGRIRRTFDITRDTLQDTGREIPVQEITNLKRKILEENMQIEQSFVFIGLEPSVGRWSAGDLKSLQTLFKDLFIRSTVMLNFHLFRQDYRSKVFHSAPKDDSVMDTESEDHRESTSSEEHLDGEKSPKHRGHGKQHRRRHGRRVGVAQTLATMTVYEFLRPNPEVAKLGQAALQAVEDVSRSLLAACNSAITTSSEIMDSVNDTRWWGRPTKSQLNTLVEKHMAVLDQLKRERDYFTLHAVDKMVDPVSHLFGEDGKLIDLSEEDKGMRLPGLMIGINYRHRVLGLAASLIALLERLVDLEMNKTETRFWLPLAITGLFSVAFSPEPVYDDNALERTETRRENEERKSRKARQRAREEKKQMARSTKKSEVHTTVRERNKLAEAFTGLLHWLTNSEGIFAARVVLATIIISIPTALKSSAEFCHNNRAIWALIMAQLTVSQYMGDFVFSITMRTLGTVVGGIMGLLVWYIGTGSGTGNAYGIMASFVPFIAIVLAIRIYAPGMWMMPAVMGGATMMLVAGYSWEANHLPSVVRSAPGYGVFYERLLLVIIGFAVATAVQVFPRPPSATRNCSNSLATILSDITEFYSETMTQYLVQESEEVDFVPEKLQERISKIYTALQELIPRIKLVQFEPSSSPFTSKNLLKIESCLGKILESLSIISFVSLRLTPTYQRRLDVQTDFAATETIASVMAILGVLEGSLRTGHPVAEVLPVPLLGRLRKVAGPSDGIDSMSRDMLRDEDWMVFAVVLMSVTSLYSRIDDLVIAVKDAVGEKYYVKGLPHHRHPHAHLHASQAGENSEAERSSVDA